jgi:hypothetical protein
VIMHTKISALARLISDAVLQRAADEEKSLPPDMTAAVLTISANLARIPYFGESHEIEVWNNIEEAAAKIRCSLQNT